MPLRANSRPRESMIAAPMLPVLPRYRKSPRDDEPGKVRDFYTLAKRESNGLESRYHMQARIGFHRARATGIKLRPLSLRSPDAGGRRFSRATKLDARAAGAPLTARTDRLVLPPLDLEPRLPGPAAAASEPFGGGGALIMDAAGLASGCEWGQPRKANAPSSAAVGSTGQAGGVGCDMPWLRKQACSLLFQASEDGSLDVALGSIRKAGGAPEASDDGSLDIVLGSVPETGEVQKAAVAPINLATHLAREISDVAVESVGEAITSAREELGEEVGSPRSVVCLADEC